MNPNSSDDQPEVPRAVGLHFLGQSAIQQDRCAAESRRHLVSLPQELTLILEAFGILMLLADKFASCFWGCHGKEHIIEDLVARAVIGARATSRLIEFGHYDEALALLRTLAEIGNLIWLFYQDPNHIRLWIDNPEGRKREYTPFKVRLKLEALAVPIPHDKDEYAELCDIGIHPNPDFRPNARNAHEIPTVGGWYQENQYIDCICKLSLALAKVVGPAVKVAILERDAAESIVKRSTDLIRLICEFDEPNQEVSASSDRLSAVTDLINKEIRSK